jgi:hypothetical protein
MKIFYKVGKYEQWIEIERKIKDFSCLCPDFIYRRLKKWKTEKIKPCKHLEKIIKMIDKKYK